MTHLRYVCLNSLTIIPDCLLRVGTSFDFSASHQPVRPPCAARSPVKGLAAQTSRKSLSAHAQLVLSQRPNMVTMRTHVLVKMLGTKFTRVAMKADVEARVLPFTNICLESEGRYRISGM